jgi:hypothetical protein
MKFGGLHAFKTLSRKEAEPLPTRAPLSTSVRLPPSVKSPQQPLPSKLLPELPLQRPKVATPQMPVSLPPVASDSAFPTPSSALATDVPWTQAPCLQPGTLRDVLVMPEAAKNTAADWIRRRLQAAPGMAEKALIIAGPGGCGKATLVRTICRVLGVECTEPETFSLKDVYSAVLENASTSRFHMGARAGSDTPRVFLFSGLDGYHSASAGTSGDHGGLAFIKLLSFLDTAGDNMPPIVFTVHDLEGSFGWTVRSCPTLAVVQLYRVRPCDRQVLDGIRRLLQRICYLAKVPDQSETLAGGFDGDIKQAILRVELSVRGKGGGMSAKATAKDMEVDDFEATKILLNPDIALHFDDMAGVFGKMSGVETVMRSNYLSNSISMEANAFAADAWSQYDLMQRRPEFGNGLLVTSLRLARHRNIPFFGALRYEKPFSTFSIKHALFEEYRNGSQRHDDVRVARAAPVSAKKATASQPCFRGSPLFFTLSDSESLERLYLLKRMYDATGDVAEFQETYGVASNFLSRFETKFQVADAVCEAVVHSCKEAKTAVKKRRLEPSMTHEQYMARVAAAVSLPAPE